MDRDASNHAAGVLELAKCGCDCWYCADCCERKGYNLRAELIARLESFRGLMMLTLTVDPKLFPTPKDAYLYIRRCRAISTLLQRLDRGGWLHSRRYFYVVEFQRETQQAHFHVLIDASFVPKPAIDAAWSKHRPASAGPVDPSRPAFGMTRFSVPAFASAVHAARYATKYLVKVPEDGWPAWVLAMGKDRRIPRYGTSRGFWQRERRPIQSAGTKREVLATTYAERVAACGTSCNIFRVGESVDHHTGEVCPKRTFLARVAVAAEVIALVERMPGGTRRRTTLVATTLHGAIGAIQAAAGHPVRVISGIGSEGRAP